MRPSTLRLFLMMGLAACATACSPPSAPQPDKPPAPQTTAAVQAIHAPLDKAKAVEGQVQASKEAQDKQIEADTQ